MYVSALWPAVLGALAVASYAKPTKSRSVPLSRRAPESAEYVSTEDGHFVVNGTPLNFVGTNAYWLAALDKEEDVDKTLADIAAAGIRVVRTWGFNDVVDIPESGTWFQQIKDGQVVAINEGPNGLQKLDKVIELAKKHNIYVLVSLTNNWNPHTSDDGSSALTPRNNDGSGSSNQTRSRNELSNDYGGMDVYVREFGLKDHDEFYRNPNLVNAFKNYTSQIVKRYVNNPQVFGWELANDPRCNSTLPAGGCSPKDVTRWHADIADHIRTLDKNHLISSGNGGYLCLDCPKLFPLPPAPPPPAASPAPGSRRRSQPLTKRTLIRSRLEALKKRRSSQPQARSTGRSIRGRWTPTSTRRQEDLQGAGPAYDGSYGVDSQDIAGIPDMDFGSFQYFPDQNKYGPDDPNLSPFENAVNTGNEWIRQQGEVSSTYGKPITLNAFGLVTQDNLPHFSPFNGGAAAFGSDGPVAQAPIGVSNEQRNDAYKSWIDTGLTSGLTNMFQYQWGQPDLTVAPGTPVGVATGSTGVVTNTGSTGVSPNDGYAINDQGRQSVIDVIQQGNQAYGNDASGLSRR